MSATDIVAYTYKAEQYTPAGVIAALDYDDDFDGWRLGTGVVMTPEENLDELAAAFGINRQNEHSFDSDVFPKVIFGSSVEPDEEFLNEHGEYVHIFDN